MIGFPGGKLAVERGSSDDMRWITKWVVGRDYAVQPGRGKKSIARIRITGIRREDVRQISEADVKAEGFTSDTDFWAVWCNMHDPAIDVEYLTDMGLDDDAIFAGRPDDLYQAWVLEFELVPGSVQVQS